MLMVKPSSNQILKLNKLEAYPISKETHVENYKTCFKTPNKNPCSSAISFSFGCYVSHIHHVFWLSLQRESQNQLES